LDESIAANNQISNVVVVEKFQQFGEVGVDEHLCLSHAMHERSSPRQRQNELEVIASAKIPDQKTCPGLHPFLFVPRIMFSSTYSWMDYSMFDIVVTDTK